MVDKKRLLPAKCPMKKPCVACGDFHQVLSTKSLSMKKRLELLSNINASHEPFIHRLPVEVASQIFVLCLPEVDLFEVGTIVPWYAIRTQVAALTGVCLRWRSLALRTPKLWSNLVFDLNKTMAGYESYLQSVKELLQRSRSLPLSFIALYEGDKIRGRRPPVYKLLNAESHRWHTVHLQISDEDAQRFLVPPTIHAITIRCGRLCRQKEFRLSGPKPKPVKAHFHELVFKDILIDWSRVTDVTIGGDGTDDGFVSLLEAAPCLKRLVCYANQYQIREHVQRPPLVHPSLQEYSGPLSESIARIASFPSLSRLAILREYLSVDGFILPLIQRSFATQTLRSLSLDLLSEPDASIESLRQLPQLIELTYSSLNYTFRLLDRLNETAVNPTFLPNLESLKCTYSTTTVPLKWSSLATLFPPSTSDSASSGSTFRPMNTVIISNFLEFSFQHEQAARIRDFEKFIGVTNIEAILGVRKRGLTLIVKNLWSRSFTNREDVIGLYMKDIDELSGGLH